MNLRSQIFAALSAIFLGVVVLILWVSLNGTKDYLQNQLATHAQETATALSVTLSGSLGKGDPVLVETQVLSVFDRGYFKTIAVLGTDRTPILRKSSAEKIEGVPLWFVSLLPLETSSGEAFVTAGWRQLGKVIVVSQPTFAYQHLWNTTKDMLAWLTTMYLSTLALAWWMLRIVLQPLDAIEIAAQNIQAKHFEPITLIPRAPELRRVIAAMNMMSRRVAEMLETEAKKVEKFQKEAYEDEPTGVANRRGYEVRLDEALSGQHNFDLAGIVAVEIDDIRILNRTQGFATGQRILMAVVESAREAFATLPGSILARNNEFSFSFVSVDIIPDDFTRLARGLRSKLMARLVEDPAAAEVGIHIGVAYFHKTDTRSHVFARADLAVESARQSDRNGFFVLPPTADTSANLGSLGWRNLIQSALVEQRWRLVKQPVKSLAPEGAVLQGECLARLVDGKGELVSASHFMPMAARHRLMPDVDKAVFALAIGHLEVTPGHQTLVAINIAPQSMADAKFVEWLEGRLRSSGFDATRLAIEISEFGVLRNRSAALTLRDLIRRHGGKFGIDHFGLDPQALQVLREVVPDYVKLSGALMGEIERTEAVRHMLKSFVALAHSLDILVVAQQVERESQVLVLRSVQVDAGQGYFFGAPQ